MRIALVAASLALVGGMSVGCGSPPEDASEKDFCKAMDASPDGDEPSQDDIDDWVDELEDTGTPDDISDSARDGFELMLDALEDVDVDELKEAENPEDIVEGKGDQEDVRAFYEYYVKTCIDERGELPADLPSDLPSDFPSDMMSEMPSDFPSDLPTSSEEMSSYMQELESMYSE